MLLAVYDYPIIYNVDELIANIFLYNVPKYNTPLTSIEQCSPDIGCVCFTMPVSLCLNSTRSAPALHTRY